MLRQAMGAGVSNFQKKTLQKCTVVLGGGGWVGVKFPEKKCYITFEWPPVNYKPKARSIT